VFFKEKNSKAAQGMVFGNNINIEVQLINPPL